MVVRLRHQGRLSPTLCTVPAYPRRGGRVHRYKIPLTGPPAHEPNPTRTSTSPWGTCLSSPVWRHGPGNGLVGHRGKHRALVLRDPEESLLPLSSPSACKIPLLPLSIVILAEFPQAKILVLECHDILLLLLHHDHHDHHYHDAERWPLTMDRNPGFRAILPAPTSSPGSDRTRSTPGHSSDSGGSVGAARGGAESPHRHKQRRHVPAACASCRRRKVKVRGQDLVYVRASI